MTPFFTHWRRSLSFLWLLVAPPLLAASPQPVTAIYYHGNILTGVGLGAAQGQPATQLPSGPTKSSPWETTQQSWRKSNPGPGSSI